MLAGVCFRTILSKALLPDRATEHHADYAADSLHVLSVAEASVERMWEGSCILEEHI